MSLQAGAFTITSVSSKLPVGRSEREDLSLNPKRIITLPQGVQPPIWEVQRVESGNYILKARGNPTATFDRLLWAVLLDQPRPSEWKITARPQAGPNTFTIELANSNGEGWVVPGDTPEQQVTVRPLIIGPSEPPFFPPTELFLIRPLLD